MRSGAPGSGAPLSAARPARLRTRRRRRSRGARGAGGRVAARRGASRRGAHGPRRARPREDVTAELQAALDLRHGIGALRYVVLELDVREDRVLLAIEHAQDVGDRRAAPSPHDVLLALFGTRAILEVDAQDAVVEPLDLRNRRPTRGSVVMAGVEVEEYARRHGQEVVVPREVRLAGLQVRVEGGLLAVL